MEEAANADIKAEVRRYVVDEILLGVRGQDLRDDDSFLEGDLLDSTGVLSLVMFLEERYGIDVTTEETIPDNLDSLRRIEAYVLRKLGQAREASAG